MSVNNSDLKSLSKNNTLPFLVSALMYCCLLGSPFLLFIGLRGLPASLGTRKIDTHPPQSQPEKSKVKDKKEENTPTKLPEKQNAVDTKQEDSGESITSSKGVNQIIDDEPDNSSQNDDPEYYYSDGTPRPTQWYLDKESIPFIVLTRLAIFSSVLCFGALGAAISLITRARSDQGVPSGITKKEIFSIQTVGAVFALILSLLFMGAMIGGTLFPNSEEFYYVIYIPAAFAKLLVWSFIAGFAERFVPNLLNNFLRQADSEKKVDELTQTTNSV